VAMPAEHLGEAGITPPAGG